MELNNLNCLKDSSLDNPELDFKQMNCLNQLENYLFNSIKNDEVDFVDFYDHLNEFIFQPLAYNSNKENSFSENFLQLMYIGK